MSQVMKATKRSRPESGHSVILLIKIFYVFSNRLKAIFQYQNLKNIKAGSDILTSLFCSFI